MAFNEWVGHDIPSSLNATMKRYNVSPSDMNDLMDAYGTDWLAIERAIKTYTHNGMFSVFEFWNRRPL